MIPLIISNGEMNYIMKIVKILEELGLVIKDVSEKKLKMKQKNRTTDFLACY